MMQHTNLEHRFVRHIPDRLDPGVLYISMDYATAAHSCCCGCGEEIVTPFTPTDWQMTFDGETISLWPSIGNWSLACRSHYVIERGRVWGAGSWSDDRIERGRRKDKARKTSFYENQTSKQELPKGGDLEPFAGVGGPMGWWSRIRHRMLNPSQKP